MAVTPLTVEVTARVGKDGSSTVGEPMTKTPGELTVQLCEEVLWWHEVVYGHTMTMDDIRARSRLAPIVLARADCMRRLRFEKGWSYPRIGQFFGMDHTTVMHNVKRSVMKPVANKHGLGLPELRIKREYDRYRKANPKRRMGQVVGQPTGEKHEMDGNLPQACGNG